MEEEKIETVEEMEEAIADDIEETKELEAEIDAELEEMEQQNFKTNRALKSILVALTTLRKGGFCFAI